MNWRIQLTRRTGTSHLSREIPCQDSITKATSDNGNWSVVCVSDGAGSAPLSEHSSNFTSNYMCSALLQVAQTIEEKGPGSWINDFIIGAVLEMRQQMKTIFDTDELDQYHCTLVALLVGPMGALSVHIGDGAVLVGKCAPDKNETLVLNDIWKISEPENGVYKNETYFVTEPHWLKHLRINFLGDVDWFLLGSDGGIDLFSTPQGLDVDLLVSLATHGSHGDLTDEAMESLVDDAIAAGRSDDDISIAFGYFEPNFHADSFTWKVEPNSKALEQPQADHLSDVKNQDYTANNENSIFSAIKKNAFLFLLLLWRIVRSKFFVLLLLVLIAFTCGVIMRDVGFFEDFLKSITREGNLEDEVTT